MSVRINPVDRQALDLSEVATVSRVLNTLPHDSEVAYAVRDVLDALVWLNATADADVEIRVERKMN